MWSDALLPRNKYFTLPFLKTLALCFLNLQNGSCSRHPPLHTHTPQHTHTSSLGELPDLLQDEFLVHFDNLLWGKLFWRRQSSCVALTAPLSHKWYLKSRKQMRAKAPFKVHLRCLKSIYTHILLRSLLYELLMNSTFCYPTFLIHRGKKKQTRKPMQAVRKQMHHSKAGEASEAAEQQGTFAKRGDGRKRTKSIYLWDASPYRLKQGTCTGFCLLQSKHSLSWAGLAASSPGQVFGQRQASAPRCPEGWHKTPGFFLMRLGQTQAIVSQVLFLRWKTILFLEFQCAAG